MGLGEELHCATEGKIHMIAILIVLVILIAYKLFGLFISSFVILFPIDDYRSRS